MTHNNRYERHYDALSDQRRREADTGRRPVSLPQAAYEGHQMAYSGPHDQRAVWAWIPWTDGEWERVEAHVEAWTDTAVRVVFYAGLTEMRVVVWRQAVTNRVGDMTGLLQALPLPEGFTLTVAYQRAPTLHAPDGAVLEADDVWRERAWVGYRLTGFSAKRGVSEVAGSGVSLVEARRDVGEWIVAHGGTSALGSE